MDEIKFELDTNIVIALLIIFVVLKLMQVVNWSWWWVISPLWIPMLITLMLYVISRIITVVKKWK